MIFWYQRAGMQPHLPHGSHDQEGRLGLEECEQHLEYTFSFLKIRYKQRKPNQVKSVMTVTNKWLSELFYY